ncbi:RNA polymerase sigma factor [Terrisporobacter vanillatitrophus]|uniref:RNA polymerase sigma factor n=1 Tax=Terrisporobacter vanillatitrophus TaxID=3058402 RepID=UPI0033671FC5
MRKTLLKKVINNEKKAYKKLMIKNSEYIYKLAFLHTKYEEDAKNIMKRTVLYINNNLHMLPKYDSFEIYITKVTIKHINEYLEEMGMVEQEDNNDYIDENGYIDIFKGMDLLDIHLKNVVVLIYFYNMSYKEVGEILNMDESTVKLYLRNSLKFMKDNVKGDFGYDKCEAR